MAKSHFYTLGGTDFEGQTKTEAKERAMEAAALAFTGEYYPRILTYRNHTLVVYRDPHNGWLYRILDPARFEEGTVTKAEPFSYSTPEPLEEALRRGIDHLVQITWTHEDEISVPDFVKDSETRKQLESWMRFQLRFKYFREQGHDNNACHRMACEVSRYECPVG